MQCECNHPIIIHELLTASSQERKPRRYSTCSLRGHFEEDFFSTVLRPTSIPHLGLSHLMARSNGFVQSSSFDLGTMSDMGRSPLVPTTLAFFLPKCSKHGRLHRPIVFYRFTTNCVVAAPGVGLS